MYDSFHATVCEHKGHSWVTYLKHPTLDEVSVAWTRKRADYLQIRYGYKPTGRSCYWCGAILVVTRVQNQTRLDARGLEKNGWRKAYDDDEEIYKPYKY